MAYNPPLKNTAFEFYVSLVAQSNTKVFQSNPTLAAGDAKVSKDGGALANLATLPSAVGSGKVVKIPLSSTEMNANNVTVILSDASGAEWCDLVVNIQPVDVSVPANVVSIAAGAITAAAVATDAIDADAIADNAINAGAIATGALTAAKFAAGAIDAAALAADAGTEIATAVWASGTRTLSSSSDPTAAAIADAVWDEALSGHTTAGTAGKALGDAGAGAPPSAAAIADAVWDEAAAGHVTAGSTGKALSDAQDGDFVAGSSTAAATLKRAYDGIVYGQAATGTLSTTQATTNLSGYANDAFNGRTLTVTSGSRIGQQTTITDYASTGGLLTFAALTGALANGDQFFIA